jgi:serine/threonine-protein kinase
MTEALGPFIVPSDVSITAVTRLPAALRRAAGARPGDFAITRPRSRAHSKIVDGTTAALLESFRAPTPIADAVIAFCRQRRVDPQSTLIEVFPLLRELVRDQFLVPLETPSARPIVPSLLPGARVLAFEVVSCIQVMDDTELYQVVQESGQVGALKIARTAGPSRAGTMVEHEGKILRRLQGGDGLRLLASDSLDGRPFIITAWCSGAAPAVLAEEFRSARQGPDRRALVRLACAITDAYADLHARGVVHGDVHRQNLLVDAKGRVTILDFGFARVVAGRQRGSQVPRGGVAEYLEPEHVRAVRAGAPPPAASRLSDQYGVAALLFQLFTGSSYLDFSLQEAEVHRQIAEDAPLSFARRGAAAWPDLEAVLRRALSKDPAGRYRTMRRFSADLARVRIPEIQFAARRTRALDQIARRVRSRIGLNGPLLRTGLETPPFVSVNFGTAGLAWAAYRLACIEDRPEWLALAEIWLQRSRELLNDPHAFACATAGLPPDLLGPTSLYHSPAGLHCVEAAVAAALGDAPGQRQSIRAFVGASDPDCEKVELAAGAAGTLLACVLLRDAAWAGDLATARLVRPLADRTMHRLIAWMESQPPVAVCTELPNLGIAHGWAGVLYAILLWCESTGTVPPPAVSERLNQLAECAEPSGRGVRWPWRDSAVEEAAGSSMPGWCNGAAGFVHLWTAAHRLLGEDRFARLGELAGWETWEHFSGGRSLCCGLAGRSYALLRLFRHTGEAAWLDRAWQLAERAARQTPTDRDAEFPDSLYRGAMGMALLAADLASPSGAFMPFFEPEGWPRVREESR